MIRSQKYPAEKLCKFLQRQKIATMVEMRRALGGPAEITVYQKLCDLSYLSSYSHSGSFYTLEAIPDFDEHGLWTHGSVHFSRHGNLLETAVALVEQSEAGYFSRELEDTLEVCVRNALLHLVREKRLNRRRVMGRYLYHSTDSQKGRQQLQARTILVASARQISNLRPVSSLSDGLKPSLALFIRLLDEKQRRLYAGLESLKSDSSGDIELSQLLGMDVKTIARGRQELLSGEVEFERVRRVGAGRKPVEKKLLK